ncbi:SMI1/KNR4 family protein [Kribbella catacumbae]|uniref:SMI1/KNR4 family protein n=1 Tax=Kribbella catacumbae TaxID=460086 RepID=UPI000379DDD3|nr:SMI1/KNR4 family protein [Kribbella catacumbae]
MNGDTRTDASAILTGLAEKIAQVAPPGWKRAVLRGYATGHGGAGHHGFWFEPKDLNGDDNIDVFEGLRDLHTTVAATGKLTVDLEVEARGRYRAVLSERLDRGRDRGFYYLFDKESEPPEIDRLAAAPDAAESGDPGEAVALLTEYHQLLGQLLESKYVELSAPLPPSRRRQILDDAGVRLPRDLDALYAVADGGLLLHGFLWFGLETLAEFCDPDARWWVMRGWQRYLHNSFVNDFGPPAAIRRLSDHPAWVPFATDGFGDYLAVDLVPGPNGRPGQVILIGRHQDEGPIYVADSVTELVRAHVQAFTSGRIEQSDDGNVRIDSGDLYEYKRPYDDICKLKVTGMDAAPVRGMRAVVRELSVSNTPWVDLGPVRGAPALWKVAVSNCAGVDLSPLSETPVEVVHLATDTIDLSGLQGHPTVGQVVLRSEKPIDLRPLASCPRLYALDLTDAPAVDISGLGQLTGLRYLRMLRPQWQEFLSQQAIPPSLAVAELAEEPLQERKLYWSFDKAYEKRRPTLPDALEWAEKLTGNATDIVTIKGKFKPSRHR